MVLAFAASACTSSTDNYPIGTGGGGVGGGGGGGVVDSGATSDAGTSVKRVCVFDSGDPTKPGCSATVGMNITVSLGTVKVATTTNPAGDYTLTSNVQPGLNQEWRLAGGGIVGTIVPVAPDVFTLPALGSQDLVDLKAGVPGSGSTGAADVFIHVFDTNGNPASGVSATAVPNVAVPLYDNGAGWANPGTVTGATGYIWFPAVAQGTFTVTLTKGASVVTLYDVHAETNFVTFQTAQLSTFQ
jgi:hypothetical protein